MGHPALRLLCGERICLNLQVQLINSGCSLPSLDSIQQLPWKHSGNALITSFVSLFHV